MLSPDPLILGVDEACVFCFCTSPSANPGISANSGRRQFCALYVFTRGLCGLKPTPAQERPTGIT